MGYGRSALAAAAFLATVAASPAVHRAPQPPSSRSIAFQLCNETIDTAFFAVAYAGAQASRTAQGWTKVNPGHCNAQNHIPLPADGWFSYYVITQSGRNYRPAANAPAELICARPDDFTLERAAAADRLGSPCPPAYDMLKFRKVDETVAKSATYTVHLTDSGLSP